MNELKEKIEALDRKLSYIWCCILGFISFVAYVLTERIDIAIFGMAAIVIGLFVLGYDVYRAIKWHRQLKKMKS